MKEIFVYCRRKASKTTRFIINLEMIKQRNFLCGRHLLHLLQIDNNLSGKMARRDINIDEYRAIFGDSDDEDTGDIEGDSSDIDFEGIEDIAEESDEDINEETANEGAAEAAAGSDEEEEEEEEEEETWTAELSEIDVTDFSAESGIAIDLGVDPKADNFLHSCLTRIFSIKSWWKQIAMLVKN